MSSAQPQPQTAPSIRERIAEAATRLFCDKGYSATTVSEIVAQAGVTKPVLYYYFGSKAGLFDHLFASHFGDFKHMLESVLKLPGGIRERLVRLTREQFAYSRRHRDRLRFVMYAVFGPQKGIPRVRFPELKEMNARLFERLWTEGIERGELARRDPEQLGMAYMGMVHMHLMRTLGEPDFQLTDEVADRLVDIFLAGAGMGA